MPFARPPLPDAPGVASVLLRSLMANRQDFERHLGPNDHLLVPPLPADMGLLDWHRHADLVAATYEWTAGAIARAKADGHRALG